MNKNNINDIVKILNFVNEILDNAKDNEGDINCNIHNDEYNQLCDSYNNIKNLVLKIREDPKGYKPKVGDWILGHSGSGPNTAIVFQWTEAQENVENINCIKFEPFNGVLPSWVKE